MPSLSQLQWCVPHLPLVLTQLLAITTSLPVDRFVPQVQQYGASMIAGDDDDLRDAQKKFLESRAKLAQTYEASTESTFKSEGETTDKKGVYTAIVTGLVAIAFIAPMVQFFYYTGGD